MRLASTGAPLIRASDPPTWASAEAMSRMGIWAMPADIVSAWNSTPGGRSAAERLRSPPKSARPALTRIASRFPFGTGALMTPIWGFSFWGLIVSFGATGVTSIR